MTSSLKSLPTSIQRRSLRVSQPDSSKKAHHIQTPDGRNIGMVYYGQGKKAEDMATGVFLTGEGLPSIEHQKIDLQNTLRIASNHLSKDAASVGLVVIQENNIASGNLGDASVGIIHASEDSESTYHTLTDTHTVRSEKGKIDCENLNPYGFKKYFHPKLKTHTHIYLPGGDAYEHTRHIGGTRGLLSKLGAESAEEVKKILTEVAFSETQPLSQGDLVVLHSDGSEVNPNKPPIDGTPLIPLKEITEAVQNKNLESFTSVIQRAFENEKDPDDHLLMAIDPSQLKPNESVQVVVFDFTLATKEGMEKVKNSFTPTEDNEKQPTSDNFQTLADATFKKQT